MQPSSRQSGFTVLEALVALAILTGVAVSILLLLSTLREAQLHGRSRLTSAIQAQALLNRIGRDIPLISGTRTGTFMDGRKWSIAVQPFTSDGTPGNLRPHALYDVQIMVGMHLDRDLDIELRTILRDGR
ncbi:MAG TPA: prepilin-type N-terminal cleavage/methylation domain-containing protein [Microvirga sp.]|nr:prepilin-type N-terminal cleavage/methylation domain-containing protein [Microvirga sp.]